MKYTYCAEFQNILLLSRQRYIEILKYSVKVVVVVVVVIIIIIIIINRVTDVLEGI